MTDKEKNTAAISKTVRVIFFIVFLGYAVSPLAYPIPDAVDSALLSRTEGCDKEFFNQVPRILALQHLLTRLASDQKADDGDDFVLVKKKRVVLRKSSFFYLSKISEKASYSKMTLGASPQRVAAVCSVGEDNSCAAVRASSGFSPHSSGVSPPILS